MTPQLLEACRQAVHVITSDDRVVRAGRAVLFVLAEIGYPRWLLWPLHWPPLIWIVEVGYKIVARNRPFFGKFLFTKE